MSSVDNVVIPTANACCLPSAITAYDTTTVFLSTVIIFAPFDVKPGHIMFAPLRTNLMAPLSTCCIGRKNGSEKNVYITIKN
ncbi:hypothetical protein ALC60_11558 [Trachymyrmex zeteki]|uniref:Uncharacterized protein n=1 Tax=Mycetomoellerius zeteki TaxID=64791 RepID=A0A151WNG8_9HYME|nr:hypothetical protein ALC60_11558 [Trachymyrmex zeteki]